MEGLYGLEPAELKQRRNLLMTIINDYYIKHYDARSALAEYNKITEWLNTHGSKVGSDAEYLSESYWAKESSRNRQALNKNPIIRIEKGLAIRRLMGPKQAKLTKKTPMPVSALPTETKPVSTRKSYYKIVISWTEQNGSMPMIGRVVRFFEELGLDRLEKETTDIAGQTEHQLAYKFEGTDDGFMMLKRSAMVLLDILNENNNFAIAIHGKKI